MTKYTDALRNLAEFLDANPELNETFDVAFNPMSMSTKLQVHVHTYDAVKDKRVVRTIVRALRGKWDKSFSSSGEVMYIDQSDVLGFAKVQIFVDRASVCERRVVGVEKVVIPSQRASRERVEEREVVEWDCGTLLGESALVAS